ncbi:MAG: energy-coupling factor transporter ATPase [Lachnospiraceae bacterium]|nr:energy-coupling factor transporter ATPase [Lachnospiraceae bacterium]
MLIELKDVGYTYGQGTVYETQALKNINFGLDRREFIGIIGHTGSGKSTLMQHLNGLIRPTEGKVLFEGRDIWADGYDRRNLRTHVGLVFQYPENQLFETDVISDVMFGPKNKGLPPDECEKKAVEALEQVGIPSAVYRTSPFELSGGQKRRVAIAGVLAMEPDILILDEPTAGLDPAGRTEILNRIRDLRDTRGITVLLVSHSMEDVAEYAGRLLVIHEGRIAYDGTPKEVFSNYLELEKMGLAAPQITYVMHALREKGLIVDVTASTVKEARRSIVKALAER